MRMGFKRCSPADVLAQMSKLEDLTIVGRSGVWRDANELFDEFENFRAWVGAGEVRLK